jgi:hypothetical protein
VKDLDISAYNDIPRGLEFPTYWGFHIKIKNSTTLFLVKYNIIFTAQYV